MRNKLFVFLCCLVLLTPVVSQAAQVSRPGDSNISQSDGGLGGSETESDNVPKTPSTNLDYKSICSNDNVNNRLIRQAFKTVGYLLSVVKWIVPFILIILGMVDFGKAALSDDEGAVSKAMKALVRRIIASVVIFFIPTIVLAVLNAIEVSKGIESNTQFGACTKCLFDPYNKCPITK